MPAKANDFWMYLFLVELVVVAWSLGALSPGNCFEKSLEGSQAPDVPKQTSEFWARTCSGFPLEGNGSESICFTRNNDSSKSRISLYVIHACMLQKKNSAFKRKKLHKLHALTPNLSDYFDRTWITHQSCWL